MEKLKEGKNERDVDLAEEKAENGERTENDDEDVGEEREETDFSVSAVVVDESPANRHYHRLSYL